MLAQAGRNTEQPTAVDGRTGLLPEWAGHTTVALMKAYCAAPDVESLDALHGDPTCLGLGLDGPFAGRDTRLRRRALEPGFIWNGKSFRVRSPTHGWGFNRFGRGHILAGLPFDLSIGPSHVDGRPAVRIDYSQHPRSPWWHRRVFDELREVDAGIFVGPAGFRFGRSGHIHVLAWFGIDTSKGVTGEAI
jgi:hypothetical protein